MATSETQPDEVGATPAAPSTQKTGRALDGVTRVLTDEEFASPGARKMLLEELQRLSDENNLLQPYRDKYHAVDKQLAKLEEKLQTKRSVEIVSGSCIAIGGALIGFALSSQSSPSSLPFGICGGVLLLGGIVAKAIKL